RARIRGGNADEIAVHIPHLVAVTHPGNHVVGNSRKEMIGLIENVNVRPAELALRRWLDLAAQSLAGEMQAIADAEDGNPQFKDGRVALRSTRIVHAGRAARKNEAAWRHLRDARGREIVPDDLAKNVLLADAPSDELSVLGAEVKNEDALGFGC